MTQIPQDNFSQLSLDKKDISSMDNGQQKQNTDGDDSDDSVIIIDSGTEERAAREIPVLSIDDERKDGDLCVKLIVEGKYLAVFENRRVRFQVPNTFFGFICCECQNKTPSISGMIRHIFVKHFDGEGKPMPNYVVDSERDEQFDYQDDEEIEQETVEEEQSESENEDDDEELEQEEEEQEGEEEELSESENEEETILDNAPLVADSSFNFFPSPGSQIRPNVPATSTPLSSSSRVVNQETTTPNLPTLNNLGDGLYSYGNAFFLYTNQYICVECNKIVTLREIVAHSEQCLPGQPTS